MLLDKKQINVDYVEPWLFISYKSEPSNREQTVLREVIEVWRLSAPLMIQDNSVKCDNEMRNKTALLYALGEDGLSLKHKSYQPYRLKNVNTGYCSIPFLALRCIILNEREPLIFSQGRLQVDSLHIFTVDSMQPACHDSE